MRSGLRALVLACIVLFAGVVPARAATGIDEDSRSWTMVNPACTISSGWAQTPSASTATQVQVHADVNCADGVVIDSVEVALVDESIPPPTVNTSLEVAGFPVGQQRTYAPPPLGTATELTADYTYRHPKRGHTYALIARVAFESSTPAVGTVPCAPYPASVFPASLTLLCVTTMTFTTATDAVASTGPITMPSDQSMVVTDSSVPPLGADCLMGQAAYKTSSRSWTARISQYCPSWNYLEGVVAIYADSQASVPLAFGTHYVQAYQTSTGTRRSSADISVATPGSTATVVSYFVLGQVFAAPDALPPDCTYGAGSTMVFCELAVNVRF
jgi:hypothetical protein